MTFEYLQRVIVDAQIDVENIGECVILGRNDLGEESYLIIRTDMGWTEQINIGPLTPDVDILPFNINLAYSRFEFNQTKLMRAIDRFLNDPKKMITQAEIVEFSSIQRSIQDAMFKIFPDLEITSENKAMDS